MKNTTKQITKLRIRGIKTPVDFDGLPCPDDPYPDNWKEIAWVWITDNKKKIARVRGHSFAKEIVAALNARLSR